MRETIRSPKFLTSISGVLALALILAWISNGLTAVSGWFSFFTLLGIAAAGIAILLRALRSEDMPAWLPRLTVGAALVRILAGVLWFSLLPAYGYATEVQEAGYIMEDAFQRDTAAWELAASDEPLLTAFRGSYRNADQYGGLLFLSAAVYRFIGGANHQPLLIVVLAAAVSSMTVPLGWALSKRLFDEQIALWAAWLIALFPEAVLLGSSQMREAFIMPLVASAFFGLAVFAGRGGDANWRRGLPWLAVPLVILAPVSPPFAIILGSLLGIMAFTFFPWTFWRNWRLWAALGGLVLLILIVLWLGWPQIAPLINGGSYDSPFEMAGTWLNYVSRWQAYLSERSSGWLQKIFKETPDWFNLPFLIGYGITRPLLPAQLVATSIPVWFVIGLWRSVGWTLMLAALLYAPIQALRNKDNRPMLIGLNFAVWAVILYASFWGGGDMWDNPRYRVGFIVLQAMLTAAVIVTHQRKPDPWFRRLLLMVGAVGGWFILWYIRRYTALDEILGWTVIDIFKISGAAVLTGVLLVIWDMAAKKVVANPDP